MVLAVEDTATRWTLPEGWRWVRLGDVADVVNGFGFAESLQGRTNLPYPFIKVSDMNAVGAETVVQSASNTVDLQILSLLGARVYPAGTVIFPKVGGALLTNKKRILGVEATFDNNIMGIVPRSVDTEWLFYWIQTVDLRKLSNTQALPSIRQSEVAALQLPLPPLAERKRIAAILNEQMEEVERARAAAEAQLEAAKALPAAYFRHAFQGVRPLSVGPEKHTAPSGWRWVLLTKVARLESGHTPSRYHPEWWGGSIPWIALPDIRNLDGKVAYETAEYTNEAGIANSSARILPAGTVVLSRTASVGFVTVMGREMATSQDFVDWVCGPDLNPHFLAYLLRAARAYIRSLSSGAIHQTVYVPTVKTFQVCLPWGAEQESIVKALSDHLDAAEQAQKAIEAELDAINKLPAALLRLAFAGEL